MIMQGHCWDQGAFLLGIDDPRQGKPWSIQGNDALQYNLDFGEPVSAHAFLLLH